MKQIDRLWNAVVSELISHLNTGTKSTALRSKTVAASVALKWEKLQPWDIRLNVSIILEFDMPFESSFGTQPKRVEHTSRKPPIR